MDKIKVMTIFGTRPEAIKMAPLIKRLEQNEHIESLVCVTGQHREMLNQVLNIFNIKPDFNLDVMTEMQTLAGTASKILEGLTNVFTEKKPDIVLVHGDTLTTAVSAWTAFFQKIMVGHVEAGLRTYDKYSPFPEEMNRKITGCIADIHFAPTESNRQNLLKEGVNDENILITGNTVIDAIKLTVKENYIFETDILNKIDYKNKKVIVLTAHRRENLGEPLKNIFNGVKHIVENNKDVEVVYPVHLNPAVKDVAYEILGNIERIHLINPLDVSELHNLMNKCYMVMTDSGGLQEEAPSLGKPVLVLRSETERPEAVAAGTARMAGIEKDNIIKLSETLINDKIEYEKMAKAINPYGDGHASQRIVEGIIKRFEK